jgi:hypothetical protein
MRFLFVSAVLALIVSSCKTASTSAASSNDISIGRACGMCRSECFKGFRLKGDVVERFTAAYLGKMDSAKIESVTPLQEKDFRELVTLLPDDLSKYPDRVGCPDCHDQCGVQIVTAAKTIMIDPADYPKEFGRFFEKLKEMGIVSR